MSCVSKFFYRFIKASFRIIFNPKNKLMDHIYMRKYFLLFGLLIIGVASCKKEASVNTSTQAATDDALIRDEVRERPQQARLACAVRTDNTDLGARQEVQRHVVEHDLVAVRFARLLQDVDELGHGAPYLHDRVGERPTMQTPILPGCLRAAYFNPGHPGRIPLGSAREPHGSRFRSTPRSWSCGWHKCRQSRHKGNHNSKIAE